MAERVVSALFASASVSASGAGHAGMHGNQDYGGDMTNDRAGAVKVAATVRLRSSASR